MNKAEITVAFLDVGQGDSIVIILLNQSSAIVVDCPKDTTIDYLNQKEINVLNYVFLTHTDRDHIGGIINLEPILKMLGVDCQIHARTVGCGNPTLRMLRAGLSVEGENGLLG